MAEPITATNEAVLMTDPPPPRRYGMPCLQQKKTERTLTSWTRCQDS